MGLMLEDCVAYGPVLQLDMVALFLVQSAFVVPNRVCYANSSRLCSHLLVCFTRLMLEDFFVPQFNT